MKPTLLKKHNLLLTLLFSLMLALSPHSKGQTEPDAQETANQQISVINVNQAGLAELQSLKGIGPVTAQRILDYRKEHGDFSSIEALTQIRGISLRVLEQNKGRITL